MIKKLHTLCLVDDDIIHQFIIKKLANSIKTYSEELLIFGNGEEAIKHLKSASKTTEKLPDILLLDLNMPIMDGWEFLNEYMSIAPSLKKKIRIYILSSSDHPEDIEKAKEYEGISDYLIKPITEIQLSELIERPFDNSLLYT